MKLNVAVVEGGYSHEKIVSKKSAKNVFDQIDRSKYNPYRVVIDNEKWSVFTEEGEQTIDKNDFSFQKAGSKVNFGFIFIVIHGTPGEDGILQAYFDLLKIPYSTSNQLVSALTFNKFVCNQYLKNFDIKVPESMLIQNLNQVNVESIAEKFGFPCFIKPVDGGSSFGVTKVKDKESIIPAVKEAFLHGTQVVVEKMVSGSEVTNGIYTSRKGIHVLPITELVSSNEFFDYNAKYEGGSDEITPARISGELTEKIQGITKKIYQLLGMRGIARVDYIIEDNMPYLIEVNTVPGQSAESIIPQMAREDGISLFDLFNEVIEVTLKQFN